MRKLQKQLRSIEALIAARERGDTLNEQQLLKLEGEGELRRKLGCSVSLFIFSLPMWWVCI